MQHRVTSNNEWHLKRYLVQVLYTNCTLHSFTYLSYFPLQFTLILLLENFIERQTILEIVNFPRNEIINAKFLIFLLPMAPWSLLYVKGSRNTYIWPCIILTMCTSILEYSMKVDGCCFHNFVANRNLEGHRTFQLLFSFNLRSQEEEWSKIERLDVEQR